MKRVIVILITTVLLFACGDSTKKSNSIEQKLSNSKEKITTMKKVLFVLTSHEDLGDTGKKTGFWLEEFSDPYYLLIDNRIEITLASPKGGKPPMDPSSASENYQTEGTKRFESDVKLQKLLSNTILLNSKKDLSYYTVFL